MTDDNAAPPPASGEVGEMVQTLRGRSLALRSLGRLTRQRHTNAQIDADAADLLARVARERDEARKALSSIARNTCRDGCQEAALVARAALAAMEPAP